jgi:HSP20 family protein
MRREMDDLFGHWFGRQSALAPLANWPSAQQLHAPLDFQETDVEYVVRMDVPGVSDKDIKVTCHGDTLTIRGERKEQKTEGKSDVRYTERAYGFFTRTMAMPAPIKAEEVRARYKDGVLEVHVPKAQKTAAREIKIDQSSAGG